MKLWDLSMHYEGRSCQALIHQEPCSFIGRELQMLPPSMACGLFQSYKWKSGATFLTSIIDQIKLCYQRAPVEQQLINRGLSFNFARRTQASNTFLSRMPYYFDTLMESQGMNICPGIYKHPDLQRKEVELYRINCLTLVYTRIVCRSI